MAKKIQLLSDGKIEEIVIDSNAVVRLLKEYSQLLGPLGDKTLLALQTKVVSLPNISKEE
jgi:hypothetical protein